MTDFVGTFRDDDLKVTGNDSNNRLFGLGGDDSLTGGINTDHHFGGPGRDFLDGGGGNDGRDLYYYNHRFDDIYIFDYASVSTTRNRIDGLVLYTEDTDHTRETMFGLEHVRDAFFQLEGETTPLVTPGEESLQDTNAYIETDSGVIEIFDQYGGDDSGPPNSDTQDGVEFIYYRWLNVFGSTTSRRFDLSSETEVFTGRQTGDNGSEFFFGTRGPDEIFGNGGDDLIFAGAGRDTVEGGTGVDHLVASRGLNLLDGGSSGDIYYWNEGYRARNFVGEETNSSNDELVAGFAVEDLADARLVGPVTERDLVLTNVDAYAPAKVTSRFRISAQQSFEDEGRGVEYLRFDGTYYTAQPTFSNRGGEDGDFIVAPGNASRRLFGGAEGDAIFAGDDADTVAGQKGEDFLDGAKGRDVLRGGGEDDVLRGGPGGDTLRGGGGDGDIADYGDSKGRVIVDLQRDAARGGAANGDALFAIEGVSGSHRNDVLRGDAKDNHLIGDRGGDRLVGRFGDDLLDGEEGGDRLVGKKGRDMLRGRQGDDDLRGGLGNDTHSAGQGDDVHRTGGGRDRVRIGEGDGTDTILDWDDGRDRLLVASGAERFSDLNLRQQGDDLRVRAPDRAWTVVIRDLDEDQFTAVDVLFPG